MSDTSTDGEVDADSAPVLRLGTLIEQARARYPRAAELELRDQIAERRIANLDTRKRPALSFNAQSAYHSSVAEIPGGFAPSPPQDQYGLSLDVEQRLWDGGRTAQEREIEEASRRLDRQGVATGFQRRRQQLEALYFQALFSQAETRLLASLETDLSLQLATAQARWRAGSALAGEASLLEAELESQRQRQLQTAGELRAAVDGLSVLTGAALPAAPRLEMPAPAVNAELVKVAAQAQQGVGVERSELTELDDARALLGQRQELAALAHKPVVSAFASGGVGRPADQDFFSQDPAPFVVAGVRLRWQPLDWGKSEREGEILALEQQLSHAREAELLETISISLSQLARRVEALDAVLASDDRILELRAAVTRQAAAQLREGLLPVNDYLRERNAEHRARLVREQHRLERARALVDFSTTLGAPE